MSHKNRASQQSNDGNATAVTTSIAGGRIPVLQCIASICGGLQATLPIKVDSKMNLETLRPIVLQMYNAYCQDEGVPFHPPSKLPGDYDIHPAFEDGSFDTTAGGYWVPQSRGGAVVRDYMATIVPPVYVRMDIGRQWLERDDLFNLEAEEREAIHSQRNLFVDSAQFFSEVSLEKRREAQIFRDRQTQMVGKVETALVQAYLDYRSYEDKMIYEYNLLRLGYQKWREQVASYLEMLTSYEKLKRMVLSSSAASVNVIRSANQSAIDNAPKEASDETRLLEQLKV